MTALWPSAVWAPVHCCCCCCCCVLLRDVIMRVFAFWCLHVVWVSPPENSPKPLAQPPVDAGLTGTAIHVPRRRALDASKVGRSDDGPLATTSAKTDSIAVGAEDDTVLSKAVEQFYTGRQHDSGSVKVFSHYSTSLCYSALPTCLPPNNWHSVTPLVVVKT